MFTRKDNDTEHTQLLQQAVDTQDRWYVFLDKMETKAKDFCKEVIPELKELYGEGGEYLEQYDRVKSGVKGQLENIRKKVYDTYEEKIIAFFYTLEDSIDIFSSNRKTANDIKQRCQQGYRDFNDTLSTLNQSIDAVEEARNLENEYQAILNEYEQIKNKFTCTQCGGNITIEKIFFITAHITCPYCRTQNTFEPGTQARGLEFLARQLAEQRTKHLLDAYILNDSMADAASHQLRNLRSDIRFEENISAKNQMMQQAEALEKDIVERNKNAQVLYENYLRKMFDEWNAIVPDMLSHNEGIYNRMLQDFRKTIKQV